MAGSISLWSSITVVRNMALGIENVPGLGLISFSDSDLFEKIFYKNFSFETTKPRALIFRVLAPPYDFLRKKIELCPSK